MLINVPQYIDVEDKVAGPLTLKQLGWVLALGIVLLIMWSTMPLVVFLIIGFPIALLFLALAFYKPYGQPLGSFIVFGILYFFRPKIYVWKRNPEREQMIPKVIKTDNINVVDKKITAENLSGLAKLLDSEGMEHVEGVDRILKREKEKKI